MRRRQLYSKLWWLEAFKDWFNMWFSFWDGCEPSPNLEAEVYRDFKRLIKHRAKDKDFSILQKQKKEE